MGSIKKELKGLLNNGTFSIADENNVPTRDLVFGSYFVNELKYPNHRLINKNRIVLKLYVAVDATNIYTIISNIKSFLRWEISIMEI